MTNTTKPRKSVRFCEEDNISHLDETSLTKEERKPLHYTSQELGALKHDMYLALGKVNRNAKAHTFCIRGLETLVDGSYEDAMENRKDYVREVVELYHDVHDSDVMEEALRQFSTSRSKADKKEALKKAKSDETEAWRVYKADKMRGFRRTTSRGERSKAFVVSLVQGLKPRRQSLSSTSVRA